MITLRRPKITVASFATLLLSCFLLNMNVLAQSVGTSEKSTFPVIVEAESGILGDEWKLVKNDDGSLQYATITTDYNKTTGDTDHPGANRTISYEITFPAAGAYDFFVRLRVGSNNFDDDSFFEGNGFGPKDPEKPEDWLRINGLAAAGFAEPEEIVRDAGALGSGVWKWVNLSRNVLQGDKTIQYTVAPEKLTVTFQIGARENGLDLDKFAFGRADLVFTVEALDTMKAGTHDVVSTVPIPTLTPIAQGKKKFLGNVYSAAQQERFTEYWNQVTPENAGKWGSIERKRDIMDWTELDAAYALAQAHQFPFRYHVLVWGNQQPAWIASLPPDEQLDEIREWFAIVAERYPDITYLEVVNEPLHDPPDDPEDGNYLKALGGTGTTGWDWVINAFQLARQYFPNAKLMINEYGIADSSETTQRYVSLISLLKERGLIDGVGLQGHAFSTGAPASVITGNLDLLAIMGLPIQVTEMDIDGPSDQEQLEKYQRIFPIFWEHPAVQGITLWGWKPGMWRTQQRAFLMPNNVEERPAMQWLRKYVEGH